MQQLKALEQQAAQTSGAISSISADPGAFLATGGASGAPAAPPRAPGGGPHQTESIQLSAEEAEAIERVVASMERRIAVQRTLVEGQKEETDPELIERQDKQIQKLVEMEQTYATLTTKLREYHAANPPQQEAAAPEPQ